MSDNFPSTSVQTAVIDANINSNCLSILLLGIYTTVYLGTMYIYLTKKPSHSNFVLVAISILYLANVAQTSIDWFLARSLVGLAGQPKEEFFIFSFVATVWATLANDIICLVLSTVADGLLIWRCYHVWDRSLRVILAPLIFLVAEAALYLSVIICALATNLHPGNLSFVMNDLLGAAFFTSLGSTLLTTTLIVYRILSVQRGSPIKNSTHKQRFTSILDLIVQSAALYGLVLLANAIIVVVPLNGEDAGNLQAMAVAQMFIPVTFSVTAGFAPTVMVARVALLSSEPPVQTRSDKISGLEFNVEMTKESNATCMVTHSPTTSSDRLS